MKIDIQYVQIPTSESMTSYVENRLNKLAAKYSRLIRAEVFLKREKDPKGKGRICEMEFSLPGPRIFASSNEKNFELAVKQTISDIEKRLQKRKSEIIAH